MTGSPGTWADSGNPFGFETNTHPSEYEYCQKETGFFPNHGYKCSSAPPPRPHPDILEYELLFVEQVGLCYISAKTDSDLWYYWAGQPEGDSSEHIDIYDAILDRRFKEEYMLSSWERHVRTQIRNFLEELGLEQNHANFYEECVRGGIIVAGPSVIIGDASNKNELQSPAACQKYLGK